MEIGETTCVGFVDLDKSFEMLTEKTPRNTGKSTWRNWRRRL